MFARRIDLNVKPETLNDLTRTLEKEIVPVLRKQNGFKDVMFFINPGTSDAFAISLWDKKENAEFYHKNTYPQVMKTFERYLNGTPQVRSLDVPVSTVHQTVTPTKG